MHRASIVAALAVVLGVPAAAAGASDTSRYILPPGNFGGLPFTDELLDQLPLYDSLMPRRANVTKRDIRRLFLPENFRPIGGVHEEQTGRPGLRLVYDEYGIPHVYGRTRAYVAFGAGWTTARDRDLLVRLGRGPPASRSPTCRRGRRRPPSASGRIANQFELTSNGPTRHARRRRSSARGACRGDRGDSTAGSQREAAAATSGAGFSAGASTRTRRAAPGGLLLNWNNRSAPGFMHGDDEPYGSLHRVELFDRFPRRPRLTDDVGIMNRAATEDVRSPVWPIVSRVLRTGRAPSARAPSRSPTCSTTGCAATPRASMPTATGSSMTRARPSWTRPSSRSFGRSWARFSAASSTTWTTCEASTASPRRRM